jgi:DNA polymerase-1
MISQEEKIKSKFYSVEEIHEVLDPAETVFFDTETDGLYGPIMLAQLYQTHLDFVILLKKPDAFELAIALSNYHLVMHYASYDISTIQRQSSTAWVPAQFDCTFYLSRLAFWKEDSFKLTDVLRYVFGYDPYTKIMLDKSELQTSDWSGELTEEQVQYACMDVYFLRDLYEAVKKMKTSWPYELDMTTLRCCLEFQNNGMPTLPEAVESTIETNLARIDEIALPVNCNSYQQVRKYIGETESDGLALAKFGLAGNQKANDVREVRSLLKQINYVEKYRTERVFGLFAPAARSGRLTCVKHNLQQIPRKLKHCFGFEVGGDRVLVYADYPTIELRTIAAITGEHRMAKLFSQGVDIHGYTATDFFGPNFTKDQRHFAKTLNFGLLYGGGASMARNILIKDAGMLIPLFEMEEKKRRWLRLWPAINAWQKRMTKSWRNGDAASTPGQRKYFGERLTDYLNIQNQGFAAEINKLAIHHLMPALKKLDSRILLINFVHDSFLLECPNEPELYQEAAIILSLTMQEAWYDSQINVKIDSIPINIEAFVGYDWGSIEDNSLFHFKGTQ